MDFALLDRCVGMIISALGEEASLLLGVDDELKDLRDELISMNLFLKESATKQLKSEGEKAWITTIRDIANQSEDIIDEFMYNLRQQHRRSLRSIICFPKYLWINHHIATKLKAINIRIQAAPERRRRYDFDVQSGSSNAHYVSLWRRDSPLFVKEEDVVGLTEESQCLNIWLTDKGQQQRTLISVFGMGGCGKTTLVRKAYNNEMVKRSFDCYGWITVSQAYTRENLFRSLIEELYKSKNEQVTDDLTTKDFGVLGNIIDSYLLQKRYLVILDDVWDANALGAVISAFPENQLGSRIVQTTRNETVGTSAFGLKSVILRVQRLDESLSWELFCRKAFSSFGDSSCPKELEETAKKLVAKCEGLPLAIVAMAGLMSSKKAKNEWLDVYNSLSWQLSNNHMLQAVESILLLSFSDLPDPLKYCFLYCSLFPHGYAIRRKRLIRLLIAEGFVRRDGRAKPKQVADSYIMELVFRSMLQVVVRNEFGRPKAFKMHDLLRELALSMSEKEKFCTFYDGRVAMENIARRVSVQNGCEHLESYGGIPQIRSLLAFMMNSASSLTTLLSRLHFIRVLDLEHTAVEKLPEGIGNLFNLTYLNLTGTKVRKLPKSIRKLNNLQTLDIRHTLIKKLPKGIDELQNLEHLSMYRFNNVEKGLEFQYVNGTRASMKLKKLKKLEVITCIEAKGDIIRQIGRMTQLTRVGISNLRQTDNEELCSAIQNLIQLQDLFLMASSEDESFGLNELQSPPPYLRNFVLAGKLQRVPHWFSRLENLTDLGLYWPRLEEDVLPHIAELPNLGKLSLCNAYIGGDQLHFSNGFKKLRFLFLLNMPQLKLISIDEEVMPDVQEMTIGSCESLTGLPRGIERLKNLKTLVFPSSILDCEGKDYWKVQHIPRINKW